VGRAFAHRVSLLVPVFSVKVVRHRIWDSFCGRLWKKVGEDPRYRGPAPVGARKTKGLAVIEDRPTP
jgi:hypothetical protein